MSHKPAQEPSRPDVSQFTDSELIAEITRRGFEVFKWDDLPPDWVQ